MVAEFSHLANPLQVGYTMKVKRKDKQVYLFQIKTIKGADGTDIRRKYLTDGSGERKKFWAYFKALRGSEAMQADGENPACDAEYTLNWNPCVTRDIYVEDIATGKIYNVLYVDPFEGYRSDMKLSVKLEMRVPGGDEDAD